MGALKTSVLYQIMLPDALINLNFIELNFTCRPIIDLPWVFAKILW